MTIRPDRPWYCLDQPVDEYRRTLRADGEPLPMLKFLHLLRATVVNMGVIAIAVYAMFLGGDPTIVSVAAIFVIGASVGLELGDYMQLLQAYREVQQEQSQGDEQ